MNPPSSTKKHRALQLRMPVFVAIVAGFALVLWAWKFNRANRNVERATMSLNLAKLSRSTDPKTRRIVAYSLADTPTELATETVEPLLIAASRDPDPGVRAAAVRSLVHVLSGNAWERTGDEMAGQVDRALPTLTALLDDRNPEVRAQVATALGTTVANLARARHGKVDDEMRLVVKPLVKAIREDEYESVRVAAAAVLGVLHFQFWTPAQPNSKKYIPVDVSPDPTSVIPALEDAFRNDPSEQVRLTVIPLLFAYHPKPREAPPVLVSALRSRNSQAILRELSYPKTPYRYIIDGWTNSDAIWPVVIDILRDGSDAERFGTGELLIHTLRTPPLSVVPRLVDLLTYPGTPFRDRIAFRLTNLPTDRRPGPDAMKLAAEMLAKLALMDQKQGGQGAAMLVSLLGIETAESPEIRRDLVALLRGTVAKSPVRSDPNFADYGSSEMIAFKYPPLKYALTANQLTGILANFGPNAADVVPELVAMFQEHPYSRLRDLLSDLFLHIGPPAVAAVPLLKERADAEISHQDGETMQISVTFENIRMSPLLVSSFALFSIAPDAPETRSLVVPIAILAENAENTRYRIAARTWLNKMFRRDSSHLRQLANAVNKTTDPRTRAALLQVFHEFSP